MLISKVALTDTGIRIYDGDGSIQFPAHDALELAKWIRKTENYTALLEIMRREQARQKEREQEADHEPTT